MSRDWRPIELLLVDKEMSEKGDSLRNSRITFNSVNENGEKISTSLTNEKARELYPEASFLFSNFDKLYTQNHSKEACKVYEDFEKALKQAITNHEEIGDLPEDKKLYLLDEKEFLNQTAEMVAEEWFYGRLDSNFYYSTENDKAMLSFIQDKLSKIKQKNKDIERE